MYDENLRGMIGAYDVGVSDCFAIARNTGGNYVILLLQVIYGLIEI